MVKPVVEGAPTNPPTVAESAAAAFMGAITQAFGATASVAENRTGHAVAAAAPIVMRPDWFVLPATTAPFVVVPQVPDVMVGKPAPGIICENVAARGVVAPITVLSSVAGCDVTGFGGENGNTICPLSVRKVVLAACESDGNNESTSTAAIA